MNAVHESVLSFNRPVTLEEIHLFYTGVSKSRIRSLCYAVVNKNALSCEMSRTRRYVPTDREFNKKDIADSTDSIIEDSPIVKIRRVGGKCEGENCVKKSEIRHKGMYFCRDCFIGCSEEQDIENLKNEWMDNCGTVGAENSFVFPD